MRQRVVFDTESSKERIKGDDFDLKHRKKKPCNGLWALDRRLFSFSFVLLLFLSLSLSQPRPPTSLSTTSDKKKLQRSFLGFEDLDVVDPTAGSASRGASSQGGAGAGNVDEATRMTAFANFREFIGMDITSLVTLPVWIMEPYTLLQKVAEIMEYTDALEKAVETEDEFER